MRKIGKIMDVCVFVSGEILVISIMLIFFWYETPGIQSVIISYSIRISIIATLFSLTIWTCLRIISAKQINVINKSNIHLQVFLMKVILFLSIPLAVMIVVTLLPFNNMYSIDAIDALFTVDNIALLFSIAIICTALRKRDSSLILHSTICLIVVLISGGVLVIPIIVVQCLSLIIIMIIEKDKVLFIKQSIRGIMIKQYMGLIVTLCFLMIFIALVSFLLQR